jgi:hypothetical protein
VDEFEAQHHVKTTRRYSSTGLGSAVAKNWSVISPRANRVRGFGAGVPLKREGPLPWERPFHCLAMHVDSLSALAPCDEGHAHSICRMRHLTMRHQTTSFR